MQEAADDDEEGVLDKAAFLAAGGTEADFALLDVGCQKGDGHDGWQKEAENMAGNVLRL